jgi:ADP-ribose pyrophosphatase
MFHTTKPIYQGRVLQLGIESLTLPNGENVELEIVHHPGGGAVVALDARENVCLLRQYRHASGGWLWELPAGKLEPNEKPLITAKRELLEEAGVHAGQWQGLGDILMTPGFCDEVVHLFLARELTHVTAQPEAHEVIEVHWVPFDQALARVYDGTLRDAKTMLGMALAEKIIRQ